MYNVTDGYSLGQWLKDNGYSFTNFFIADIVLGAKSSTSRISHSKIKR